jgi:hypothetical protein
MVATALPTRRDPLSDAWGWCRDLFATVFSNAGKAIVTGRCIGATPTQTEPKFVGIGSGAGTAAVGDTTLFTEYTTGTWAGYARTSNTPTQVTTTVTNDTLQNTGTFTAGAAQTVTNAGIFDALTGGNLLMKGDFTGVVLANGDSISITAKLQFS